MTAHPHRQQAPEKRHVTVTEREQEVIELVSRGFRNSEIAERLHIAEDTVKTHLRRLKWRLCVADRAHLTRVAIECGIVTPDEPTMIVNVDSARPHNVKLAVLRLLSNRPRARWSCTEIAEALDKDIESIRYILKGAVKLGWAEERAWKERGRRRVGYKPTRAGLAEARKPTPDA